MGSEVVKEIDNIEEERIEEYLCDSCYWGYRQTSLLDEEPIFCVSMFCLVEGENMKRVKKCHKYKKSDQKIWKR